MVCPVIPYWKTKYSITHHSLQDWPSTDNKRCSPGSIWNNVGNISV